MPQGRDKGLMHSAHILQKHNRQQQRKLLCLPALAASRPTGYQADEGHNVQRREQQAQNLRFDPEACWCHGHLPSGWSYRPF
jgi:hypothetical protein